MSLRFENLKTLNTLSIKGFRVAADLGFEPRQTESESVVLPLHKSAVTYLLYTKLRICQVLFAVIAEKLAARIQGSGAHLPWAMA